ncbi:MAG: AMP-dependent synthetase/ligase [Candidatus Binatia bacterium]
MSDFNSIPAVFFASAARGGDSPRYMVKRSGRWETVSWKRCLQNVEEIAAGLLNLGLEHDDRVAILAATRPEWLEVDLAALSIGCVTVPIYSSSLPEECGYILNDSGARVVFAENPSQAKKILGVAKSGIELSGSLIAVRIDTLIVIEGDCDGCMPLDVLRAQGRARLEESRQEIRQRTEEIHPEKLATIVYTSGTTGQPKGVMQSHGNHLSALRAVAQIGIARPGDVDFSFLPLAHSFGRMMEYFGLYVSTVTAYAEKIETLMADIMEVKPHFLPSVPRIYEKAYSGIMQARDSGGTIKRRLFDWAVGVGERRAAYVNRGEAVPTYLGIQDRLAHALIFRRVHDLLGGRMRYMISGGAPLSAHIIAFFHAVGLPILEGYGLTETTPILTCNLPQQTRIGTVGKPIAGVTLRIAEDGEILARGPNIAYGYYNKPEATAEAWDGEGWFHTGDIGLIEDDYLRITDRKKELIKTAGGKYVAPQKIENMLKGIPCVSQAVLIGDRLKYCVALLTLDIEACQLWSKKRGTEPSTAEGYAANADLRAEIDRGVQSVNARLASFESVKYFHILQRDFSIESGELTPSLKVKRKVVTERYSKEISSMVSR